MYSGDFTPPQSFLTTGNTLFNLEVESNLIDDETTNSTVVNSGTQIINSCPQEDLDGDGVAAWEDCDDTDPTTPSINDQDCDGYSVSEGDCDDNNPLVHPLAGDVYDDGVDSDCDGNDICEASEFYGVYFVACYDPRTWLDASNQCQSAGYDGLATITSSDVNDFVHSIQPVNLNTGESLYWIGLNDMNSEGSYVWDSGMGISFTNWATGEPNNINNEDCAHMYNDSFSTFGQWNDHVCSTLSSYICEAR